MAQSLDGPSVKEMQSVETLTYVLMLLSIIACGLVLIIYAIVACQGPETRKLLDRVSFRLLVETTVCNFVYGITLMLSFMAVGNSAGCRFGAFFMNLVGMLGIFLTACIAINSQLVLIHGFNGKALEKFYVIVSVVLAAILCGPAYAYGQLGVTLPFYRKDDTMDWCWFNNPDKATRIHWMIGSQSVWVGLASALEIVSSSCVILWLFRSKSTIFSLFRREPVGDEGESSPYTSTAVMLVRDPKYRRIIVRIAMVDVLLLGGRNVMYSALALADPSFTAAVSKLTGEQSVLSTRGFNQMASQMLNGVVSALNLKETSSSGSTSSDGDITGTSFAVNASAEGGATSPSESLSENEREYFQRLEEQL
ncbi:hypothetical protein H0H92_004317 [Tricholoma furcatifolium]|nr:hypothetical protein H0H92_004317 [Tricholoma furcatifolium]